MVGDPTVVAEQAVPRVERNTLNIAHGCALAGGTVGVWVPHDLLQPFRSVAQSGRFRPNTGGGNAGL